MNDFKWRHFERDIILGCVKWYCKYEISYRELEEIMEEWRIDVDHEHFIAGLSTMLQRFKSVLGGYWKPGLGNSLSSQ